MFGHFLYGLHYEFDLYHSNKINTKSISNINNYHNPYSYMIMLRNPIERVISHYYYLKDNPNHPLYGQVVNLDLKDWINFSVLARDEHCRRIVGIPRNVKKLPLDFKEQCIFRLKYSFKYIGITERFEESLFLLSFKTGFKEVKFVSKNIGIGKQKSLLNYNSNISLKTIEKIISLNQNDLAAYEIAKEIFEKEINSIGRDYFYNQFNKTRFSSSGSSA